jgi:hypothetical protein
MKMLVMVVLVVVMVVLGWSGEVFVVLFVIWRCGWRCW